MVVITPIITTNFDHPDAVYDARTMDSPGNAASPRGTPAKIGFLWLALNRWRLFVDRRTRYYELSTIHYRGGTLIILTGSAVNSETPGVRRSPLQGRHRRVRDQRPTKNPPSQTRGMWPNPSRSSPTDSGGHFQEDSGHGLEAQSGRFRG